MPPPPPVAPLALTSLTGLYFFVYGVFSLARPGLFYFCIPYSSETLDGVFLYKTATRKIIFRTTRCWKRGWSLVPSCRVLSPPHLASFLSTVQSTSRRPFWVVFVCSFVLVLLPVSEQRCPATCARRHDTGFTMRLGRWTRSGWRRLSPRER